MKDITQLIYAFVPHSAPVERSQPHFSQYTGGLACGSSHNRVYQCLLQRRTTQPVSMVPLFTKIVKFWYILSCYWRLSWSLFVQKENCIHLTWPVCFLLSSAVWWRSQATWQCPSLQASPGFSQPTPTFLFSASGWSTSRGSITSCQIRSCSTGQLSTVCFALQTCLFLYTVFTIMLSLCLVSDPSQSDPDTRDFWFNMQALQLYLQREAELNPQASYYNVGLLKYQVGVWN